MEISNCFFLRLMSILSVFKYNFWINITEENVREFIEIKRTSIKRVIKKYFWRSLGILTVLIDFYFLYLLVPKLNVFQNEVCYKLSNHEVPMSICDIFKLSLSILFLHFYLKYYIYRREWESYKWLENFIIVGSYIGVFIIVLILSCIVLIIIPNTTFEKLAFVILIVLSYFAYYTACTTDWFDKYIYSECHTYTSTVNHIVFKDKKYLIITDLAKRWRLRKIKEITQKKKIDQPAPQDPRLCSHPLVSKGLNDNHHQFTSLKTSQPLDCEQYLQSTRIVRSENSYNQPDTFAWGMSDLNEYPNKFLQYKLIPL
uniref:Transmembrane protein n=1 Tax=Schizaphis graminum TaxID=13262 RepID=A0A2S2PAT5_SCHGA